MGSAYFQERAYYRENTVGKVLETKQAQGTQVNDNEYSFLPKGVYKTHVEVTLASMHRHIIPKGVIARR